VGESLKSRRRLVDTKERDEDFLGHLKILLKCFIVEKSEADIRFA